MREGGEKTRRRRDWGKTGARRRREGGEKETRRKVDKGKDVGTNEIYATRTERVYKRGKYTLPAV